ncbi:MAG: ATP synthase F0 subunit A [Archangium gephyra]|uniref:ATP synthase subunit a n=1 Tax=Archangium gephyra TaxID=48 RepID=A0A2W5VAT9_9BACT|nr:MAG: ATP synthase F0 subunit A [Archangium gephyra]
MKRFALVVLALFSINAFASDGHDTHGDPNAPVDKKKETADFILHHVADDTEFEYEIPFPPYHLPAIHIADAFSFLKFETVPGACDGHATAAFASFPSLEKFIHGCYDLRPTKAILMMWTACAVLLALFLIGSKRDQNGVPRGTLSHSLEAIALFVRDEIATPNLGKAEAPRYTPYLLSLFFFILAINWLGLFPGMFTGTGVITVTAALAVTSFIFTQIAGIRAAGLGGYLAHLTGGVPAFLWPVMIPVEVLGLFTKPFALLVRLFANMLGGHMVVFFLLSLIFVWHPGAAAISLPLTIAIFCLEIFVGILQAYLFTLLTALFIGQGVAMGHHGHDDHGHEAHGDAHH